MLSLETLGIDPNEQAISKLSSPRQEQQPFELSHFHTWLSGPEGHLRRQTNSQFPQDGAEQGFSRNRSALEQINLEVTREIANILFTLLGDASKIDFSIVVPALPNCHPHGHLFSIQKNEDGTLRITTEDREGRGVLPEGATHSRITSGTLDAKGNVYDMKGKFLDSGSEYSHYPDIVQHDPVSATLVYLLQARYSEEFFIRRAPANSFSKINSENRPSYVNECFRILDSLYSEGLNFYQRLNPQELNFFLYQMKNIEIYHEGADGTYQCLTFSTD